VQDLDGEGGDEAQRDDGDSPQDAGAPAQPQAQVSPTIGHESTTPVDDEDLLLRDDGDDRRGRDLANPPVARPNLEQ
jgi:hypothetical protein